MCGIAHIRSENDMRKWTIFSLLKMVELLGLAIVVHLCHLFGDWYNVFVGDGQELPYAISAIGGFCLLLVIGVVLTGIVTGVIVLIKLNIQWADKLSGE